MDKLNQLLAQLHDLKAKLDALLTNDALTPEQLTEHDMLIALQAKVMAQYSREKQRLERDTELAKLDAEATAAKQAADAEAELQRKRDARTLPAPSRLTDADLPTPTAAAKAKDDDKIPATVRRTGSLKCFRGQRAGRSADERAYRFGMFGLAMLSQQLPNRFRFPAAVEFLRKNMAVNSENDTLGTQFLIPEEFSSDLIDLREQYGVARRICRMESMMSDTKVIPRRKSGLTAYFVPETQPGTETNKQWNQIRLVAKDVMVLSRWSAQVNQDAVINFGDDLAGECSYAFSLLEDQCLCLGTGSSTYGGIIGVTTKLQDIDGAGTDSAGLVSGTGNLFSELTLIDFQAVLGKLPQYADTPNAVWVVHRGFYYNVMQKLELAAGGVTALEISKGDRRPRPLFLGYPVEFSQVMPSAQADTTVFALLGDFTKGVAFGDRQAEAIAFSEHASVGGENVFERNEIAIRATERIDINVHDVGSATDVGPIVGLQTIT